MKRVVVGMLLAVFAAVSVSNAQVSQSTQSASTVIVRDSIKIGGVWISKVDADSTMAAKSDNFLPTQKAVKSYVDNNVKSAGKDTSTISAAASIAVSAGDLLELLGFATSVTQTIKIGVTANGSEILDSYKITANVPAALRLDFFAGLADKVIYISGVSAPIKLTAFKR